jgi:hypothetical protein
MEQILITFPNDNPMAIDLSVIDKTKIMEPKVIGDTVFFWLDNTYASTSDEDFKKIMKK